MALHKAKDNSFKLIFNEPELFIEFLKDFVPVDILKDVTPTDNVPENEISTVTERLYERRLQDMFALLEDYDVQATRREAKEEGKEEGKKEGKEEGVVQKGIEDAVNAIKAWHVTVTEAMNVVKLDPKYRDQVISDLQKQNIAFTE